MSQQAITRGKNKLIGFDGIHDAFFFHNLRNYYWFFLFEKDEQYQSAADNENQLRMQVADRL
jgi:hypothetical protein